MTFPTPLTWEQWIAWIAKNEPQRICTQQEKLAWIESIRSEVDRKTKKVSNK